MRNQIETPLEIRQYRSQQWRAYRWRRWVRTSLLALVPAVAMLGLFRWLPGTAMPGGLVMAFLLVPILLPGMLFLPVPFLELRLRDRWRWDEYSILIRGRRYPWQAFQRCEVEHDRLAGPFAHFSRSSPFEREKFAPAPALSAVGYAVLKLQFRDRSGSRGWWLSMNARTADIQELAAFAMRHIGKP